MSKETLKEHNWKIGDRILFNFYYYDSASAVTKMDIRPIGLLEMEIAGTMEYFCDHMNPAPDMLYKDKTYVAVLESYLYVHGSVADEIKKEASASGTRLGLEYIPASLASGLYLPDGSMVEDEFREKQKIYEVTEGFYETDAGKRLLNLAKTMEYQYDIQPVTGTNKTCLLMPFYMRTPVQMPGGNSGWTAPCPFRHPSLMQKGTLWSPLKHRNIKW